MSRSTMLSPAQLYRLDQACKPVREAFGHPPYLVGSAERGEEWRDVDVRLILADEQYDVLDRVVEGPMLSLVGIALSHYLSAVSGLPVDFQVQRQTEANSMHAGRRNPLGMRSLYDFRGDATPPKEGER